MFVLVETLSQDLLEIGFVRFLKEVFSRQIHQKNFAGFVNIVIGFIMCNSSHKPPSMFVFEKIDVSTESLADY